ncbi:MAG: hypothetical protein QOK88_04560 [Nitrososphaeraceae archaeon]|nr:hypothetical protein [Nitrososphaeraceae archaeon]
MALIQDDKIVGTNSGLENQNEEDVYFNFINSLKSEVTKKTMREK